MSQGTPSRISALGKACLSTQDNANDNRQQLRKLVLDTGNDRAISALGCSFGNSETLEQVQGCLVGLFQSDEESPDMCQAINSARQDLFIATLQSCRQQPLVNSSQVAAYISLLLTNVKWLHHQGLIKVAMDVLPPVPFTRFCTNDTTWHVAPGTRPNCWRH
jgi:hypothetical protein